LDLGLPRRFDALVRRGLEDLVPRFFRRHSTPICLADKPRFRRAAKKRFQAVTATRFGLTAGIKVGQLLTLQVRHTAQSQLSLPTAGQSISREAITDFMSTTITWHRRQYIPRSSRNKAGREPSRVCVCWHTGHLVINHQLQTVPAPIAAIMNGASPCPMLTVRSDEQKESVPAHRSTD